MGLPNTSSGACGGASASWVSPLLHRLKACRHRGSAALWFRILMYLNVRMPNGDPVPVTCLMGDARLCYPIVDSDEGHAPCAWPKPLSNESGPQ